MNSNFEHQHLDYIVIRPWIRSGVHISNPYTAHLLPRRVREMKCHQSVTSEICFYRSVIAPSPTKENLDHVCELVLNDFSGMKLELDDTDDKWIYSANVIAFFPSRYWDQANVRAANKKIRDCLPNRRHPLPGENFIKRVTRSIEQGSAVELYRQVRATHRQERLFSAHPWISQETLEACYDDDPDMIPILIGAARLNANAGPILERLVLSASVACDTIDITFAAVKGPNAITYDYKAIAQANKWLKEEIVAYLHHPRFLNTWLVNMGQDQEYDPSHLLFSWPRISTLECKRKEAEERKRKRKEAEERNREELFFESFFENLNKEVEERKRIDAEARKEAEERRREDLFSDQYFEPSREEVEERKRKDAEELKRIDAEERKEAEEAKERKRKEHVLRQYLKHLRANVDEHKEAEGEGLRAFIWETLSASFGSRKRKRTSRTD